MTSDLWLLPRCHNLAYSPVIHSVYINPAFSEVPCQIENWSEAESLNYLPGSLLVLKFLSSCSAARPSTTSPARRTPVEYQPVAKPPAVRLSYFPTIPVTCQICLYCIFSSSINSLISPPCLSSLCRVTVFGFTRQCVTLYMIESSGFCGKHCNTRTTPLLHIPFGPVSCGPGLNPREHKMRRTKRQHPISTHRETNHTWNSWNQ